MIIMIAYAEAAEMQQVDPALSLILTFLPMIVIIAITVVVCGLVSKHINESKGYKGGFVFGFLGIIGIIIVVCRTDLRLIQQNNTPAAPQQPANDSAARIRELADLRSQGLISEEEYETKKAELLSRM